MNDRADRLKAMSPAKQALFELLKRRNAVASPSASDSPSLRRLESRDAAPLSFAQERLWFLYRLDPANVAYTVPYAVTYRGPLPHAVVARSVEYLVARHEALRTTFHEVDGVPVQRVASRGDAQLTHTDLSAITPESVDDAIAAVAREVFERPFVLETGPLLRLASVTLEPERHVLLFVMHHVISDAGSLERLVREFAICCTAFGGARDPQLPALTLQFIDFAAWQRHWFAGPVRELQMAYWVERLAGLTTLELPLDGPRPPVQTYRGRIRRFTIAPPMTAALRQLGLRNAATPFMTLLACVAAFLARYSGQTDIAIGSPVSNRNREETEHVIGLFANTIVLRMDLSGSPSTDTLVQRARQVVLDAHAHQDLPFEQLVEQLQPARDPSRSPLFQVFLIYRRRASDEIASDEVLSAIPGSATKFDLTITIEESATTLHGALEYNTDLFSDDTAARMARHLEILTASLIEAPSRSFEAAPILDAIERARLLALATDPQVSGDAVAMLPERFSAVARSTPEREAVVCGGDRLSYGELAARAERVAALLHSRGVQPEMLVGVAIERSVGLVVAALGVSLAGAAYVPLDPSFPADRVQLMIADARPAAILTVFSLAPAIAAAAEAAGAAVILLDAPASADELAIVPAALSSPIDPASLAYVLYTSGSTGRPKGVQISHAALSNFLDSMRRDPGLTAADRLVAVTTFSFDIAGLEFWLPLTTGATVVLASRDEARDGRLLAQLCEREHGSVMQGTPSTWRLLLEAGWRNEQRLRILIGGEALPVDLARALLAMAREIWNLYGPTETTIWSTLQRITDTRQAIAIGIGRPIANTRAYVLDPRVEPVPFGVAGELYIGGEGLARGYLGQPSPTAAAFRPDPFSPIAGARMYRTGDRARLRADGSFEFLGRADDQVKVRGFRIELGDIETALAAHASVERAVAGLWRVAGGEAALAAWVVGKDGQPAEAAVLRAFLRDRLPDYMIPSAFVALAQLPLTANGKIDRRRLPSPQPADGARRPSSPPRSETERLMADAWRATLNTTAPIGVEDDFFDLGGHSMLAARLLARVRDVFQVDLPLRALFESPTLGGLARAVTVLKEGGSLDVLSPALRAELLADAVLDPAIAPAPGIGWREGGCGSTATSILLTGATGFLGAQLLAELLADHGTRVSCLVRCRDASAGTARLRETLERFELWDPRFADRILVVPGDLDRPRFGLSKAEFDTLAADVDVIYHNGALVSFVAPYRQLRAANVSGTVEVLRLAVRGKVKPVHYVSTTDVLGAGYLTTDEDDPLDEPNDLAHGYAQSKWVAEHLVAAAGARGVPVAIYRPGRIVGHSRTGIWNTDDFACRAIRGSIELGVVPDVDPLDNMAPVDFVARAIVMISRRPDVFGRRAYHVVNPRYFLWRDLFAMMRRRGYGLEPVPYREWRRRLAAATGNALAPLLPLFPVPADAGDEPPQRWSTLPDAHCGRAQAALAGTGVTCPLLDDRLWSTYFDFFLRTGYLEPAAG